MDKINIYTDGSCLGNPGPGGWAFVLIKDDQVREFSGGDPDTTNNKMELTAVLNALKTVIDKSDITIHTDSQYLIGCLTDWIYKWQLNDWKNASNKPIKNKELIEEIFKLINYHTVHFSKVPAHSGIDYNERCDKLAKAQAEKFKK